MFKTTMDSGFLFKCPFSKLKKILTLMIIKAKALGIGKIHFSTH
jgi:hypothetical protein